MSRNKKKKEIPFLLFTFCSFSINLLLTETIFRTLSFGLLFNAAYLRILFFSLALAGFCAVVCSLLPLALGKLLYSIISIFLPTYALYQLGIFNMMHSYTTLRTAGNMAGAVIGYFSQYIRQMPSAYWWILLLPLCAVLMMFRYRLTRTKLSDLTMNMLVVSIVLDGIGLGLLTRDGRLDLYAFPKYQEKAIREFGIERFLVRDVATLFTEQETSIKIEEIAAEPTAEPEQVEAEVPEETPEPVPVRTIDDTEWKKMSEADENNDRKVIDQYLMNRSVPDYNEATGLMEGKNLIYVMIEAGDYLGFDPQLTPTLNSMMENGWHFANHYTPKFDTGTSDSELISEVSLVPRRDINVYADFAYNDWNESIFSIFNAQNYSTYVYHNWTDQFYPRRAMLDSQHAGIYENYDDLPFETIRGWQSDLEMFELTVDKFINDEKFMTMYITSSTHFPYDADDILGNRYLWEINQVHPEYPEMVKHYISKAMDLDLGMEYLLKRLEEAGKLDDTAIVFFADHHPLNMPLAYIYDCTQQVDRSVGMNEFRSPFVIYCPGTLGTKKLTKVTGTYDVLPTVLNLYNMDYDPRLYLGEDYFSDNENIVYFPDGDWATDHGIYYSSYEEFEAAEGMSADQAYIDRITSRVENAFSISYLIYITDYFAHRPGIATPDCSKPAEE